MIRRKTEIDIRAFPAGLHGFLQPGNVYDSSCCSGARTLYCDRGFYIKMDGPGKLALEAELGRRFHALGLGVEVMEYLSADRDYLVTRAAVGEDLTHHLDDPEGLCRIFAHALRRLHSQRVEGFPESAKFIQYARAAGTDFSDIFYDDYLLVDRFGIGSKEEAWEIMQSNLGRLRRDTLIHGDACLPNVICRDGRFSTFIDFGLAGAGDRHIDLFWAVWSIQFNFKTDRYTDYFLDAYGRENFDPEMLRAAAAMELFGQ